MNNIYDNNYSREQEVKRKEEEKIREEKLNQEGLLREELKKQNLRKEKEKSLKQKKIREESEKNIKSNGYNKISYKKNFNNNYLNNKKNEINNNSYRNKITKTKTSSNLINNNKKIINIKRRDDNKSYQQKKKHIPNKTSYSPPNSNLNKKGFISKIKVQQKAAILNFPNQNKKVDIYGERFDNKKYKREYINIEKKNDGTIENHIETGISKDGQYLISVSSSQKIYDNNYNENVYENEKKEEDDEKMYEEKHYYNDDNNDTVCELPEKNVEEIISTITSKKRNLGDNYKFYESKNLNNPNITSFTKHRRRTERTIYGNEEYETREVKTYKISPHINEYGGEKAQQMIETSKISYEEGNNIDDEVFEDDEGKEQKI